MRLPTYDRPQAGCRWRVFISASAICCKKLCWLSRRLNCCRARARSSCWRYSHSATSPTRW
ncbi:hypothetical protein KIF59_02255 [Enterobacter cloacae subsp. cloacae]|nr:hypothetical protein [Enterobacter cloacae subsp. cloacae]